MVIVEASYPRSGGYPGRIFIGNDRCLDGLKRLVEVIHEGGAKACMMVCPYGAIRQVHGKMIKCDLCDGNPKCAKWCPTGAIRFTKMTSSQFPRSKKTIQFLMKTIAEGR
jgi:MinD superfamily P-loop ATPase